MRITDKGMSALAGLVAVVCVLIVVIGAGALGAKIFFKADTPPPPPAATYKVDVSQQIADLEKHVRGIPAEDAAANARGYAQLLALDPGNERYRRKLAYYRARLKAPAAAPVSAPLSAPPPQTVEKTFVKIAFPAPRVLARPDADEMVGRAPSGEFLEVLEKRVVRTGSTNITWYRVPYKKSSGWVSQMGVFGAPETRVMAAGAAGDQERWETVGRGLIADYGGKITAVEQLSPEACWVQVSSDMTFEEARQISERIGYYISNSTTATPMVKVFVGDLQVAVARPLAGKYAGTLEVQNR